MANDKTPTEIVARNKEEGLEHSITATGRRLEVVTVKGLNLYRIAFADGKQGGQLPQRISGQYTGQRTAKFDLDNFIAETWDLAAEATPKKKTA